MNIKGELIRITTEDGLELQGIFFEPKVKSKKAVIHVHGWIGNFYENKFIDSIAEEVVSRGFAFLSFNNRGAGIVQDFIQRNKNKVQYKRIGGSLEDFEECLNDLKAAIDFISNRAYQEIVLHGHSLGCQKVAFYQYKKQDKRIKGLVLIAPVDDVAFAKMHWGDKYEEAVKTAKELIKEGKKEVPSWMAFYPLLSPEMFLNIADSQSLSGRMFDYEGNMREVQNITLPALAIFGLAEEYQINPQANLAVLKNKLKNCDTVLIKDAGHGFAGFEKELSEKIGVWLTKTI